MIKTAVLLTLIVTTFASIPAHAQRVFVSGLGSDSKPCTEKEPCRTLQRAFNTAPPNAVIEVLDSADYGPLTITKKISIQGHGRGGISTRSISNCQSQCVAITINVATSDPVMVNGVVLDGGVSPGDIGIYILSGPAVQILNSVVRRFGTGILDQSPTNAHNLLIEDTIVSDNGDGIVLDGASSLATAMLNRITANNNQYAGVENENQNQVTIANSVLSKNFWGVSHDSPSFTWLGKTVISGNTIGVNISNGAVKSYGDNYIANNAAPVNGSLTPVAMQ
jgi:hypothetical protein